MSASARRGAIVVALAVVAGLSCWWGLHSEMDGGRGDARALAEKPAADAAPSEPRAPKPRETAETDAPPPDVAAPDEPPPKPAPLTIRVVSGADDAPITGATVEVEFYEGDDKRDVKTTTDRTGAAVVNAFPRQDGPDVLVEAPGFVRSDWTRTPYGEEAGDDVVVVRLAPAVTLNGRVVDAATGAPLPGAGVVAGGGETIAGLPRGPSPYGAVVADAHGAFRLDGIPTCGPVSVSASAEGHVGRGVEWNGASSRRVEFRLEPTPPGLIRGVVRDADGSPVAGLEVRAAASDEMYGYRSARTRADGTYEMAGLKIGHVFEVWAWSISRANPRSSAVTHGVQLTAEAPGAVCDLVLVAPAQVTVRVRDRDGTPIGDADVELAARTWLSRPKLDAGGRTNVDVERPDRYRLTVATESFLPHAEDVDVSAGEKRTVDVVLDRGVELVGVLVNDLGEPWSGVRVGAERVDRGAGRLRSSTSDERGAFRITGCVADVKYRLSLHGRVVAPEVVAPRGDLRLVAKRAGVLSFGVGNTESLHVLVFFDETDSHVAFDSDWGDSDPDDPHSNEPIEVEPGSYDVVFSALEFAPVLRHVVLGAGEKVELGLISFDKGVALAGRVIDPDGRPVAGARVQALLKELRADHVAWTDGTGAFRVFHLPTGEFSLAIAAEGFVETKVAVKAAADAPPVVATIEHAK